MPRLRRLNGLEVIKVLEELGFTVIRVRGSHHILRRVVDDRTQTVIVPVHGKQNLGPGLLRRLYRDLQRYVPEGTLRSRFYTD